MQFVRLWCIVSHLWHSNTYNRRAEGSSEKLSGFDRPSLQLSGGYWSNCVSWAFVLVAALMPEICICFDMIRVWRECFKTAFKSPERLNSYRKLSVYKLPQYVHIFCVSRILLILSLLLLLLLLLRIFLDFSNVSGVASGMEMMVSQSVGPPLLFPMKFGTDIHGVVVMNFIILGIPWLFL